MSAEKRRQIEEAGRCYREPAYFLNTYGQIYDATSGDWVPFRLWPEQRRTLRVVEQNRLTVILKARQLGLTWLTLGFALWTMLYRPAATVLLFSRRDEEAIYLLSRERLRGMFYRLPEWMVASITVRSENAHEWSLSNGSVARAFPTTAGDSYTASLAIVDEAALAEDLGRLMRAVKPTIDGGGRMILLSRANKGDPEGQFANIYRAARGGQSGWAPVFLPWHARPERDTAWYEAQHRDILSRTGALDDLHEQYPATDTEALSPRSLDKRIPAVWIEQCYDDRPALAEHGGPAIGGLEVYRAPEPSRSYVLGADPAEGNPTSDDSALTVLDRLTGEECAVLAGKFQPEIFGGHIDKIGAWYNKAGVLVERNNHGHAVLLWLRDNSKLDRLLGLDQKPGWLTTTLGNTLLYDRAAEAFHNGETVLHSFASYQQLASIGGSSLEAPDGAHDDRADSYALALLARTAPVAGGVGFML